MTIPAYKIEVISQETRTVNVKQIPIASLSVGADVTGIKSAGSSRDKILEAPKTVDPEDAKAGEIGKQ